MDFSYTSEENFSNVIDEYINERDEQFGLGAMVKNAGNAIGNAVSAAGNKIAQGASNVNIFKSAEDRAADSAYWKTRAAGNMAQAGESWNKAGQEAKATGSAFTNGLKNEVAGIGAGAKAVGNAVKTGVANAATTVSTGAQNLGGNIATGWNNMRDRVGAAIGTGTADDAAAAQQIAARNAANANAIASRNANADAANAQRLATVAPAFQDAGNKIAAAKASYNDAMKGQATQSGYQIAPTNEQLATNANAAGFKAGQENLMGRMDKYGIAVAPASNPSTAVTAPNPGEMAQSTPAPVASPEAPVSTPAPVTMTPEAAKEMVNAYRGNGGWAAGAAAAGVPKEQIDAARAIINAQQQ